MQGLEQERISQSRTPYRGSARLDGPLAPRRRPDSDCPGWRGGFSLIEVLVAVGLTVTVSFIAVPNAGELLRQYQFATAINQLSSDIARARMQAVAQNRFIRIRFMGSDRYVTERSMDGVSFVVNGSAVKLPSMIAAMGGYGPTFNRSGLAAEVTVMSLTDGKSVKDIRTNLLGRVSVL